MGNNFKMSLQACVSSRQVEPCPVASFRPVECHKRPDKDAKWIPIKVTHGFITFPRESCNASFQTAPALSRAMSYANDAVLKLIFCVIAYDARTDWIFTHILRTHSLPWLCLRARRHMARFRQQLWSDDRDCDVYPSWKCRGMTRRASLGSSRHLGAEGPWWWREGGWRPFGVGSVNFVSHRNI